MQSMMPPAKPFTEVFSLLRQRSPVVLDILYEQYGRRLLSYALRRWGLSDFDVEDILYETFYVLILKAESLTFTSQAQFDGYIYSVFSNKLHEQFRKSRKAHQHELAYNPEIVAPEGEDEVPLRVPFLEDIQQHYEHDDTPESPLVTKMQDALATLPTADRELLELWGQGYSYDEIGKLIHLDPTHLKVKCFRAKQKIVSWFNDNNAL